MKRYLCSLFIICWSFISCNLNKTNPNQRDSQNSPENLKSSQIAFSTSLISSYNSLPEVEVTLKTQESLLELDDLTMKYDKDNKRVIYYYPQKEALNPLNIVIVYYLKTHPESQKAGQYFTELRIKTEYQPSFNPQYMGTLISLKGDKTLSNESFSKVHNISPMIFFADGTEKAFPIPKNNYFSLVSEDIIEKNKGFAHEAMLECITSSEYQPSSITAFFGFAIGENSKDIHPELPDLDKVEITGWYDISEEDIQYFTSIMKACDKIQKS